MRDVRVVAARHVFHQLKKEGAIDQEQLFDAGQVDQRDIFSDGRYYAGVTFVSSVAKIYAKRGSMLSASDASHCGKKSDVAYGIYMGMVNYDPAGSTNIISQGHSVRNEGSKSWGPFYSVTSKVENFDVKRRVIAVDQEKSIDSELSKAMKLAVPFLDEQHVIKNMSPHLSKQERATGIALYKLALRAPSTDACDAIVRQYGPAQTKYLSKWKPEQLYRAHAKISGSYVTSQAAESLMQAALKNSIRSVEPYDILRIMADTEQRKLSERKEAAELCQCPVPPRVEARLAALILASNKYATPEWVEGTNFTVCYVQSLSDSTSRRRVVFSEAVQTPPLCCAYSRNGEGLPCRHGARAITAKHGSCRMHEFIDPFFLTKSWRAHYHGLEFAMPAQHDIDSVMLTAKRLVATGSNIRTPKALLPPRGRPVKHAGSRKRSWYEAGPGGKTKKRTYTCSLCNLEGHTARECSLAQE
jgi:hypothetical protein